MPIIFQNKDGSQAVESSPSQERINILLNQGYNPTNVKPGSVISEESVIPGSVEQNALDQEMSSLSSPSDIRTREAETKENLQAQANSIFDMQVRETNRIGEKRLDSSAGQLGMTRGLGMSTAEISFLNSIENETISAVKEIEAQKAAYLKDGNLRAKEQADNAIMKLTETRINLLTRKADMALQFEQDKRANGQLELQKEGFELEKQTQSFTRNLALTNLTGTINGELANMMGIPEGTETYQKMQGDIQTAMQEAQLTGFYNGAKTKDAEWNEFQKQMQERGYDLDVARFGELKRSAKVQEAFEQARIQIARASEARLAFKDKEEDTTFLDEINKSAQYLNTTKDMDEATRDLLYQREVDAVLRANGYDLEDKTTRQMIESSLNNKLNMIEKGQMSAEGTYAVGSDFGGIMSGVVGLDELIKTPSGIPGLDGLANTFADIAGVNNLGFLDENGNFKSIVKKKSTDPIDNLK